MDEDNIHVVPMFGKPHESSPDCWCEPEQDEEEPLVWIHHPEN